LGIDKNLLIQVKNTTLKNLVGMTCQYQKIILIGTGAGQPDTGQELLYCHPPQSSPTHDGSLLKNVREMKNEFTIIVPTATMEEIAQS
jgi:hypothetical protein